MITKYMSFPIGFYTTERLIRKISQTINEDAGYNVLTYTKTEAVKQGKVNGVKPAGMQLVKVTFEEIGQ